MLASKITLRSTHYGNTLKKTYLIQYYVQHVATAVLAIVADENTAKFATSLHNPIKQRLVVIMKMAVCIIVSIRRLRRHGRWRLWRYWRRRNAKGTIGLNKSDKFDPSDALDGEHKSIVTGDTNAGVGDAVKSTKLSMVDTFD